MFSCRCCIEMNAISSESNGIRCCLPRRNQWAETNCVLMKKHLALLYSGLHVKKPRRQNVRCHEWPLRCYKFMDRITGQNVQVSFRKKVPYNLYFPFPKARFFRDCCQPKICRRSSCPPPVLLLLSYAESLSDHDLIKPVLSTVGIGVSSGTLDNSSAY